MIIGDIIVAKRGNRLLIYEIVYFSDPHYGCIDLENENTYGFHNDYFYYVDDINLIGMGSVLPFYISVI